MAHPIDNLFKKWHAIYLSWLQYTYKETQTCIGIVKYFILLLLLVRFGR